MHTITSWNYITVRSRLSDQSLIQAKAAGVLIFCWCFPHPPTICNISLQIVSQPFASCLKILYSFLPRPSKKRVRGNTLQNQSVCSDTHFFLHQWLTQQLIVLHLKSCILYPLSKQSPISLIKALIRNRCSISSESLPHNFNSPLCLSWFCVHCSCNHLPQ